MSASHFYAIINIMENGMYKAIRNFGTQFSFLPKIENLKHLKKGEKFVVVGMGGSHLAADILKILKPELEIKVYSDYGLPFVANKDTAKTLFIFSSYSGNTEETLDSFNQALRKKLNMAVVAAGGKLLALARKNNIPCIQMPETGIQPRSALGFSILSLAELVGERKLFKELHALSSKLNPSNFEEHGRVLAKKISGRVPLIYASLRNTGLAYNWKIKFNETGKIPSFYNVLPELNHNEMTGFDATAKSKKLVKPFYAVLLKDTGDNSKVQKRFDVLAKILTKRGIPVEILPLKGNTSSFKVFSSLILADWAAFYTALLNGADPENVPMVEEFKSILEV